MNNKSITELLQEYFENKDKIKLVKVARTELWEIGKCDTPDDNCIHPLGIIKSDLCPFCKKRNEFYNQIQRLVARNHGIMNSLRSKVLINNI